MEFDEDSPESPWGRCESCGKPLSGSVEDCDADGNRGRFVISCRFCD
jgi:hypothetical protein